MNARYHTFSMVSRAILDCLIVTGFAAGNCWLPSLRAQEQKAGGSAKVMSVPGAVDSLSWSPDGETLAVQTRRYAADESYVNFIQLWNVEKRTLERTLVETEIPIFAAKYSPDGKHIAYGAWLMNRTGPDGEPLLRLSEIRLLNVETGDEERVFRGAPLEGLAERFTFDVLNLTFSPDGRYLAAVGKVTSAGRFNSGRHIGGEVAVWNTSTGELIWNDRATHTDIVYGLAFSPDGSSLASGGIDKLIRIWDTKTGRLKDSFHGAGWNGISTLSYSPDGRILASGGLEGPEEGGVVRLWNVPRRRMLYKLEDFQEETSVGVAFAPAGTSLVVVGVPKSDSDPTWQMRQLDVRTRKWTRFTPARAGFYREMAIAPHGATIAVGTWEAEVVFYPLR